MSGTKRRSSEQALKWFKEEQRHYDREEVEEQDVEQVEVDHRDEGQGEGRGDSRILFLK